MYLVTCTPCISYKVLFFLSDGRQKVLLVILFQEIANVVIFAAEKDSTSSRSAYFTTRENMRLKGLVVKRFESPSLLSCGNSCLRNSWCTFTNFKAVSKNGKGTCELNKHEANDGKANLHDEQGVTFSKLRKVMHYFTSWRLASNF